MAERLASKLYTPCLELLNRLETFKASRMIKSVASTSTEPPVWAATVKPQIVDWANDCSTALFSASPPLTARYE